MSRPTTFLQAPIPQRWCAIETATGPQCTQRIIREGSGSGSVCIRPSRAAGRSCSHGVGRWPRARSNSLLSTPAISLILLRGSCSLVQRVRSLLLGGSSMAATSVYTPSHAPIPTSRWASCCIMNSWL
ncbi:hypothetical protein OBBRIDRAFT_93617 [Obba rivulosa]|uniref:Uncharacterized protein n=1 Tax=Obba rivulosa TaxID=1052685 RepID=A0A8E2AX70_9APHY|nr:hypothetical protein OBBRIDRAFT_93617 [Obba rivulosa]